MCLLRQRISIGKITFLKLFSRHNLTGFQTNVFLNPYGMSFHAVAIFSLEVTTLLDSFWAHCELFFHFAEFHHQSDQSKSCIFTRRQVTSCQTKYLQWLRVNAHAKCNGFLVLLEWRAWFGVLTASLPTLSICLLTAPHYIPCQTKIMQ